MAVTKEAIALVLDIGKSMHNETDCPTVLENAKQCINMIIQRKIFSESKDEVALVVFGTGDTSNNLAEQYNDEYENIKIIQDFQPANWELLEYVNGVQGTDISSDFIDALVVAMDILYYKLRSAKFDGRILFFSNFVSSFSTHQLDKIINAIKFLKMELNIIDSALLTAVNLLQNTISGKKFFSRRILFFSCFDDYFCSDKVNTICEELKTHKIDLNIIGPVAYSTEDVSNGNCMQAYQNDNLMPVKAESYICKILREVNGESYSFSEALPALIYYQKKKVLPMPWNANLDIGTNLTIPISAYIKVNESKPKAWKRAYAHKLNAKLERGVTYLMNDEPQTKVTKDGIIPAFKYGTTLVPYSEEDKINMDYQSGEKGMKVLGFTKAENVQRYHYAGDKSMYVFGQKNRERTGRRRKSFKSSTSHSYLAGVILAPFIQALHDTKMVAIVRYVYSARSAPKIGFLSPRIKPNYECLVFVPLPFMEDLRHYVFTPLDSDAKNIPTDEQLNAVDDLITAMDLTSPANTEDDEELLKPKYTVNPYLQRLYQCLQYRAFHPEKPLPESLPHIKNLVNPSPKVLKRAEPSLKRIKYLFPFKETLSKKLPEAESYVFPNGKSEESVNRLKSYEDFDNETKYNILDAVIDKITKVGSVNPVRDFQYLVKNEPRLFNDFCQQLMDVTFKIMQDSANLKLYHPKILSICKEFRLASLKQGDATKFNFFMTNLQNVLLEADEELWNKIRNEKITLISNKEVSSSVVTVVQAETFLSLSCPPESKNSIKVVESFEAHEDDYDNLLQEL